MDLKTTHNIFKDRILRIPSYQRGYSWSNNKVADLKTEEPLKDMKGQLKDLWDDIMNINGAWHYTGLITLVESKYFEYEEMLPTHQQFSIVDGQQRITSILILLSVIIKRAQNEKIKLGARLGDAEFQYLYASESGVNAYIFGYEKDNPSDKYFRNHILQLDEIEDDSEESVYTENLLHARIFFETMLDYYISKSGLKEAESLKTLYTIVTTKLKFNEYILPEELNEYVVFETMNNRGKPLSQLEKLKNRLMYLNGKFDIGNNGVNHADIIEPDKLKKVREQKLSDEINRAWITIYKSLGQNKQHPLDDEDFVKNHWITYFGNYNRTVANVYANFLFDEYFTLQRVYDKELTPLDVKEYIKSLQKCSIWWNKLHYLQFFDNSDDGIEDALKGIHRVGLKASFKPLLLAILTRDDRTEFVNAIKLLEKYSFKIFDISDRQSNTGDSKIYSLTNSVYLKKKNAVDTYNEINQYISDYYRFSLFVNQSLELFETGHRNGFYKWSGIKYFLFEYDMDLRSDNHTSTRLSELTWDDFRGKNSIEHIYPQSAIPSLEQYAEGRKKSIEDVEFDYQKIQNDWKPFRNLSPDQKWRLVNSLGNLLAISSSDNSSLSNDPFIFKVDQSNKGEQYKNRGYKYNSMSAMIVANYSDWTPETILDRGLDMLKFLCKYIDEDFETIDERVKYKILGLEFMYKDDNIEAIQPDKTDAI